MTEGRKFLKYGCCTMCGRWVPRDEMMTMNVDSFDARSNKEIIRLRPCPKCSNEMLVKLRRLEWDHILKTEIEIRADARLAALADLEYDPGLEGEAEKVRRESMAIEADVRARREAVKLKRRAEESDDSEGALRKRGADVPEPSEETRGG